jgi:hypothetical protein
MRGTPVLKSHLPSQIDAPAAASPAPAGFARRAGAFLLREFREILPPTIFFVMASI